MYAAKGFRAVEEEGQSLILVFLCHSDISMDLEGPWQWKIFLMEQKSLGDIEVD